MNIHFVCRGNTFRSRLAEAYLNSKFEKHKASSSGINADLNYDGPLTWYCHRLLKYNNLLKFTTTTWRKTTKKMLKNADLVIFLTNNHYKNCVDKFKFEGNKYLVWNIEDIKLPKMRPLNGDVSIIKQSEKIFKTIKEKVNNLISEI